MKQKTISKNIRLKMIAWLETITNEHLRQQVKDSIIVTGGSIASMFLKEDINDYDVYISNKEVCKKLADYYVNDYDVKVYVKEDLNEPQDDQPESLDESQVYCYISSAGYMSVTTIADKEYQLSYITSNAITLTDDVQIVTRFTGKASEIHKNYDFTHATNYWTFAEGLVVNVDAMCSLITKELRYTGSKYPLCSVIRTRKFINRGWSVTAGQYLKMILQLNDLDLKDISVLREQSIGVDSAYFNAFLIAIESKGDMSTDYLCEVIDQVFEYESIVDQE